MGGGKLIYQMTEATIVAKPNYRVQFQFNGFASLPIFEYRLDSTLTLNADIATVLRGLLKLSETTTLRFLNTYVKYQAVWDGGSDAQVNLSGDVIYFYIGNNNILNKRTKFEVDISGGLFLSNSPLYVWKGRTAYLDYLNSTLSVITAIIITGDSNKAIVVAGSYNGTAIHLRSVAFNPFDAGYNSFGQVVTIPNGFDIGTNLTLNLKFYTGSPDVGQGFAQTFLASFSTTITNFRVGLVKIGNPGTLVTFTLLGTTAGLPNESDIKATVTLDVAHCFFPNFVNNVTVILVQFGFALVAGTTYAVQIIPGSGDANNYIRFITSSVSTYASGSVVNKAAGVWTADVNKDLFCSVWDVTTQLSVITIKNLPVCANPIYLKWLNDLGGISTWLFDYNQDYSIIPKLYGRYKSLKVFANNLALDAWLMINELNKDGIDYGDNLKSGQYVVDMTDELNPLSVFIEDKQVNTQTKQTKHRQDLIVRYPLIPNTMS